MTTLFREQTPEDGTIRLEKDEDGYALWHHGRCVWRDKPRKSQFQIIEEIAKSREGKTRWR